ncbi:ArsR family transcriptional regulator [Nonomuraea africana]|uniref:ArsR family transcriptional regulator n=1 Tax=Nonomuraea africana TaxID=46171 RepID=UPI003B5B9FF3
MSQPAVSQHLRVLRDNGFASVRGRQAALHRRGGPAARGRPVDGALPPVLGPAARRPGNGAGSRQASTHAGANRGVPVRDIVGARRTKTRGPPPSRPPPRRRTRSPSTRPDISRSPFFVAFARPPCHDFSHDSPGSSPDPGRTAHQVVQPALEAAHRPRRRARPHRRRDRRRAVPHPG